MAFAIWNRTIQDEQGNVQAGASVEVRNANTNALATLYSDRDGSTLKTNPFLTDVNGYAFFFAVGGAYNVTASKGVYQMTFPYEAVGTSAETDFEQLAQMLESGVFPFQTVAQMNAFTPPSSPSAAVVYTGSGSGYYNWTGSAWSYSRALPDTFARLAVTGGTTNAPVAAVGAGVNPSSPTVFFIDGVTPNTGSVTLTITGLGSGVVRNAAGNVLTAGEWQGRIFFTRESNGEFKIVNDPASALAAAQSATLASAEANRAEDEADRAETAASSVPSDAVRYGTSQSLTAPQQAQARTNINAFAVPTGSEDQVLNGQGDPVTLPDADAGIYNSVSFVESSIVPASLEAIRTNGYYSAGDGGEALYKRVPVQPSHAGKIQSSDGAWWELSDNVIRPEMFGARGDGLSDDSSSINSSILFLQSLGGGELLFSAKRYIISTPISISNIPITLSGEGEMTTFIEQISLNENGINYSSTTPSNSSPYGYPAVNQFVIRDLSVVRSSATGGIAINAFWEPMTSISKQCVLERVRVYSTGSTGFNWADGIVLTNCNGSAIDKVQVNGNPAESALNVINPYTMASGISLVNPSKSAGQIWHNITGVSTTATGVGLLVSDWHEGIEISNCHFVQNEYGIKSIGNIDHLNPDLLVTNTHIESRYCAIQAFNTFKLKVSNCDIFKAGPGDGFSGRIVELNSCIFFSATGTAFSTNDLVSGDFGIIADAGSAHGNVTGCSFLGLDASCIDINGQNWIIGDNNFFNSGNGIRLYGNDNTIGKNKFSLMTGFNVAVNAGVTGTQITYREYAVDEDFTFSGVGPIQYPTFSIPFGIFGATPEIAIIQEGSNTGLYAVGLFDRANSSATSARFMIVRSDGATIPAGTYKFSVLLKGYP